MFCDAVDLGGSKSSSSSSTEKQALKRPHQGGGGDSSDGDDPDDTFQGLQSRRNLFKKSKSMKANYSMPVITGDDDGKNSTSGPQNRRASLPHNLKIPQIIITRSSPSPDPNHPDYPEFYEDPIYIQESKKMSTSSTEDSHKIDLSSDSLHLKLSDEEEDQNEAEMQQQTTQEQPQPQDEEPKCAEDPDVTPPFEEVLAAASNEQERQNCLQFAKRNGLFKQPSFSSE